MKAIKLLLALCLILATNAAMADTPSASDAYTSGSGLESGTAVVVVTGSNGTFQQVYRSTTGASVANIEDVEDVYSLTVLAVASYSSSFIASCTLVIPEGMTGTATYSITKSPAQNTFTYTAGITIGDALTVTGASSGTVTLSPGTYDLTSYSDMEDDGSGVVISSLQISIDEDE